MDIPKIVIETPKPDKDGITQSYDTHIYINDQEWKCISAYKVEATINQPQTITLTLIADVTVMAKDKNEGRIRF